MRLLSEEIVGFSIKVNVHPNNLCPGHRARPPYSPVEVYVLSLLCRPPHNQVQNMK